MCDRGGQAPALRFARPPPFTVGRGPVPRRASVEETALASVRFLRRSNDRGGQAPALRARKGFASQCAVRDRALPNYSHWGTRAIAGACPPRYGLQGRLRFTVGRGPVPRHASVEETALGWRSVFARVERLRGPVPRATGPGGVLLAMRRSGAGDPELQSPAPILLILLIL